jgi:CubicO group peptidase (beta-lactamase class C family)
MKLHLLILWALFAAPVCGVAAPVGTKLTPEEALGFKAAADYSKAARGVALLVMRRGEIIFEDYAPIWNASKPHLLASGTKSFCGVLAACAVEDGLLRLDEKVSDTLAEWRDRGLKSEVTVRQLLSLTSGIAGARDNPNVVPTYARAVELATARPGAVPGGEFSYGPIPFEVFGELLRRKLSPQKEDVYDYLDRRILAPIGLRVSFWRRDSAGNPQLPSGAFLTAREWVKFGELIRLKGQWEGRQIVAAEALAECFQSSEANPAYGLGWWLFGLGETGIFVTADTRNAELVRRAVEEHKRLGFQVPRDLVAAMGRGKQRCYVIPSLELVIVRMGDSEGREFTDLEFLAKLLIGKAG